MILSLLLLETNSIIDLLKGPKYTSELCWTQTVVIKKFQFRRMKKGGSISINSEIVTCVELCSVINQCNVP